MGVWQMLSILLTKMESAVEKKKKLVLAKQESKTSKEDSLELIEKISFLMNPIGTLLQSKIAFLELIKQKDNDLTVFFNNVFKYLNMKSPKNNDYLKAKKNIKIIKEKLS